MTHLKALAAALLMPALLLGCVFSPGKFASTLDIRADRSFTFTYKGEVAAIDVEGLTSQLMKAGMAQGAKEGAAAEPMEGGDGDAQLRGIAWQDVPSGEDEEATKALGALAALGSMSEEDKAKRDARFRDLAARIAKEPGYRSVTYRGDGVFDVDYAMSGKLDHAFAFPFNQDVKMLMPFVAIELRGADVVRVKAPGYAVQDASRFGGMDMPGAGSAREMLSMMLGIDSVPLDGSFTLTTDAEIVSQNTEDGAKSGPGGKTVRWTIAADTADAPMAVLKVAGLR